MKKMHGKNTLHLCLLMPLSPLPFKSRIDPYFSGFLAFDELLAGRQIGQPWEPKLPSNWTCIGQFSIKFQ